MKMIECPYCAEKIEEGLKNCPICQEPLTTTEEKTAVLETKNKMQERNNAGKKSSSNNIYIAIAVIVVLLLSILIFKSGNTHTNTKKDLNEFSIQKNNEAIINKDQGLKEKIVGTWSYSHTEESEEDGIIISLNGTTKFSVSGNITTEGIFLITYIDEEGYQCNLKYKLKAQGLYGIKKSIIIYDYNLNNIAIELVQTDNYELSNLFTQHYIPQLKQEMIVNNKEKIIELNNKYLKVETEFEGKKDTETYVRVTN
ncbi:MAG: hypothetical protein LBT27_06965 [Prevotellaceae bacterium]|nr:hypothetical protein [Prevotellaceae bacterium]